MGTVDEPSRLPLIVVIALVVLAAFGGVVWLAYTQGVERGRESVSREMTTQEFWKLRKPARSAYTGLKIYEPPSSADQSAPANTAAPTRPVVANAIPALRPTASAAPDTISGTATADQVGGSPALAKNGVAGPAAVTAGSSRIGATHGPTQLTKPAAPPAVPTHPLTEPESLAPAPAASPLALPARSSVPAAAPSMPPAHVAVSPAKPASPSTHSAAAQPSAPSAPAAAATPGVSGIVLQIGSYKSDAEARASWQGFKSEHGAAAGYQSDVQQVDLGAKGTWYRLRMGPFPDRKSALDTCRKLKADGASCLLAQ